MVKRMFNSTMGVTFGLCALLSTSASFADDMAVAANGAMSPKVSINQTFKTNHIDLRFSTLLKDALKNGDNQKLQPVFYFNQSSGVMAYALTDKVARALSDKDRNVYQLIAGESVRETINRWAKFNNYTVVYQTDVDFPITQTTTLYGQFLSEDGGSVLAQLLASLQGTTNPLKAVAKSNHVLLIQSDQYSPTLLTPAA
ncbi:TcpQ domain-containing protein [Cysteiniphilum halobium]|uniref:TcpQ domain-containing protein n=1 Tax=Cysteiniphilum halobium TaxID=2219059 RepID=UPI000E65C1B5|nr:TcpQ domain-containing protein [Cysteiniphilum halobium]